MWRRTAKGLITEAIAGGGWWDQVRRCHRVGAKLLALASGLAPTRGCSKRGPDDSLPPHRKPGHEAIYREALGRSSRPAEDPSRPIEDGPGKASRRPCRQARDPAEGACRHPLRPSLRPRSAPARTGRCMCSRISASTPRSGGHRGSRGRSRVSSCSSSGGRGESDQDPMDTVLPRSLDRNRRGVGLHVLVEVVEGALDRGFYRDKDESEAGPHERGHHLLSQIGGAAC